MSSDKKMNQLIKAMSKLPQDNIDAIAHKACRDVENLDVLKMLIQLEYVQDPRTKTGASLIHTSIHNKNIAAFEYLLERKYNIDEQDDSGRTILHNISSADINLDMVKLLISKNANLEARDDILQTPLHIAAQFGSIEIAKVLLEMGADPRIPDDIGQDPLRLAMKYGHRELAAIIAKKKESSFS